MTDRIAQIRARLDAATPGPWRAKPGYDSDSEDWQYSDIVHDFTTPSGNTWTDQVLAIVDVNEADAVFIANAPEDVAFLLAQLAEVTNQRDQARTHRRAAWDAGYAAAILDIGNEFEPGSVNPYMGGEDGTP